jgi:hypothetical protein
MIYRLRQLTSFFSISSTFDHYGCFNRFRAHLTTVDVFSRFRAHLTTVDVFNRFRAYLTTVDVFSRFRSYLITLDVFSRFRVHLTTVDVFYRFRAYLTTVDVFSRFRSYLITVDTRWEKWKGIHHCDTGIGNELRIRIQNFDSFDNSKSCSLQIIASNCPFSFNKLVDCK